MKTEFSGVRSPFSLSGESLFCPFLVTKFHFSSQGPIFHQWLFLVPLKGGIGSIWGEGKDYKWYISGIFPANWGMDYATGSHLLGEPETTIDFTIYFFRTESLRISPVMEPIFFLGGDRSHKFEP